MLNLCRGLVRRDVYISVGCHRSNYVNRIHLSAGVFTAAKQHELGH